MRTMMQDMIRSYLTKCGVIPKASPTQSQSIKVDKSTPQVVDLSEGELSELEQEGPESETPELDELMLATSQNLSLLLYH